MNPSPNSDRYAAFLAGINLGRRRVQMEDLRRHFETAGLEGVRTFIASGNVVFDGPVADRAALEARLEAHLATELGFATDTFVRSFEELSHIVHHPSVARLRGEGFTPHVLLLRIPASQRDLVALSHLESPVDRFHTAGPDILWFRHGKLSQAPFPLRKLDAALHRGRRRTQRTLETLEKLLQRFGPPAT